MTTKFLLLLSFKHSFRGLAVGSSKGKAFQVSKNDFVTASIIHITLIKVITSIYITQEKISIKF